MIFYAVEYILLLFYTSIVFNPNETADNLKKYGGFIPGIRPGERTALFIENLLTNYGNWLILFSYYLLTTRVFNCKLSYTFILEVPLC